MTGSWQVDYRSTQRITENEVFVKVPKDTFNISKRNILKAGAGVGLLGVMAGSAFAAPTDQGQISAESGQFAKIEGPSDSTIIDLSSDLVDLSSTEQMVLPIYSGTPGSLSTGSMWLDSSV